MTWDIYLCGRHGKEGGDSQGHPGRHCLVVDPEGKPGDIIEIFVFIFTIILSIIYPGDVLITSIFKIIIKIYLIIQKENQETKTIMVVGM